MAACLIFDFFALICSRGKIRLRGEKERRRRKEKRIEREARRNVLAFEIRNFDCSSHLFESNFFVHSDIFRGIKRSRREIIAS